MIASRCTLGVVCGFTAAAAMRLDAQSDDYLRAVMAQRPDHFYHLDETDVGEPKIDGAGNPIPVADAGGYQYDDEVIDSGFAAVPIHGYHEGKFAPVDTVEPLALPGIAGAGPGLCGFDDSVNFAFLCNNAGSVNLGDGDEFANDIMTVACWFYSNGSDGGDRVFTNNRPDRSDHFQITLGGSANLVIGIDPTSETVADALQVPDSAKPTKDGQWHHIVASRNGPTMSGVTIVIDGVDYTGALVDSTTGWGATGTDAHIGSRPGGDGGPNRQTLNGAVDELAVWLGRQLTVEESQDLYNAAVTCIPPAKVTRRFSKDTYGPGEEVDVFLDVVADGGAVDVDLSEILPPLAGASTVTDGGSAADGRIAWTLSGVTTKTVSYKLIPAPCAGDLTIAGSAFDVGGSLGHVGGLSVVRRVAAKPDVTPWKAEAIGAASGFADVLGDHAVYVSGTGGGLRLSKDEAEFVDIPESGDFAISARIDCFDTPAGAGAAGLCIRESLLQHSAQAFITMSPGAAGLAGSLRAGFRRDTNVSRNVSFLTLSDADVASLPVHVQLRRAEGKVFFERSPDGSTYSTLATKDLGTAPNQLNLPADVLAGLVVSSIGTAPAHAIFGDVSGAAFGNVAPPAPQFRRGDSDLNGELQLTDAIRLLGFLFLGSEVPGCLDAADTDDNGALEITDAIAGLGYLFLGSPPPPAPGPSECGPDPTPEDPELGCLQSC